MTQGTTRRGLAALVQLLRNCGTLEPEEYTI